MNDHNGCCMIWTWKEKIARMGQVRLGPRTLRALAAGGCLGMVLQLSACAGNQEAMQARVNELEQRLKEVERTSGRLSVRTEDLQDQMDLWADRIETNRLALERRGRARALPVVVATPPGGAMPTSSQPAYPLPSTPYPATPTPAPAARIPVPGTGEAQPVALPAAEARPVKVVEQADESVPHVKITEEDFNKFVEESGVQVEDDTPARAPSGGGGHRSRSVPRPAASGGGGKSPVTSERLPVVAVDNGGDSGAAPAPTSTASTPMEVYKSALASYRTGEYSQAYNQFKAYLDMGPQRDYLDNAYYWLGESSFGLGQFEQAIGYFNRVIKETPEGNKVPDAMLKASLAYKRLGKTSEAKSILYDLVKIYPSTNAAKLATNKLKEFE